MPSSSETAMPSRFAACRLGHDRSEPAASSATSRIGSGPGLPSAHFSTAASSDRARAPKHGFPTMHDWPACSDADALSCAVRRQPAAPENPARSDPPVANARAVGSLRGLTRPPGSPPIQCFVRIVTAGRTKTHSRSRRKSTPMPTTDQAANGS